MVKGSTSAFRLGLVLFALYGLASLIVGLYLYGQQMKWKHTAQGMGSHQMMRTEHHSLNWPIPSSKGHQTNKDTQSTESSSIPKWTVEFSPSDCRHSSSERLAYISLLTGDNYLPGALTMFTSLSNLGSRHEKACLITSDVSKSARAQLSFLNVTLIEVSSIPAPYENPYRPAIKNGFTKLHLWNLKDRYDKLFYIDADIIVLHNLDRMFEEYPGNFGVNWRYVFDWPRFCSCAMIIRPDAAEFKRMMASYMTTESYDHGDQGFLTTFYWDKLKAHDYVQSPCRELMARMALSPLFPYFLSQQIDFLHFAHHPKPWQEARPTEPLNETTRIDSKEFANRYWWGFYDLVTEQLREAGLISNSTLSTSDKQHD